MADVLPKSEVQASNAKVLHKAIDTLVPLALAEETAIWNSALPRGEIPLWLEDALQLEIIPGVARILGERWADDTLSFVDVSIASARLQEAVRRLGVRAARSAATPILPVILPPWEQHSLAGALAAHRICRAGRRAVLLSGLTAERLSHMPVVNAAPALLISATYRAKNSRLKHFVEQVRDRLRQPVPIITGGPAFHVPYMDIPGTAGTSCNVNDPVAALMACGIEMTRRADDRCGAKSKDGIDKLGR
jgi:hypothetical protein